MLLCWIQFSVFRRNSTQHDAVVSWRLRSCGHNRFRIIRHLQENSKKKRWEGMTDKTWKGGQTFDFHKIFLARIFTQGNSWEILPSPAKNSIPCKTFCSINTRCHKNFCFILRALCKSNSLYVRFNLNTFSWSRWSTLTLLFCENACCCESWEHSCVILYQTEELRTFGNRKPGKKQDNRSTLLCRIFFSFELSANANFLLYLLCCFALAFLRTTLQFQIWKRKRERERKKKRARSLSGLGQQGKVCVSSGVRITSVKRASITPLTEPWMTTQLPEPSLNSSLKFAVFYTTAVPLFDDGFIPFCRSYKIYEYRRLWYLSTA